MPSGPPSTISPPEEPGRKRLKDQLLAGAVPRLVTSILIASGFVWLLMRGGLPLVPEQDALDRVSSWAIAGFVASQLLAILLRTYRWVFLLRPIAPRIKATRVLGIGLVGFSAIFLAPLRMGEIVRPYLLAQDGEVSFMQAAGTLFAERVIDGLVLMTFTVTAMSLATTVSPLPQALGDLPLPLATVPAAVYTATLGFLGLFLTMTAFYAMRETAARVTRTLLGLVSTRLAEWAASTLSRVADGLRFLPSRRNLLSFLTVTCLYWVSAILGQWGLMRGAGLPATVAQAATMVGIIGLGTVVPAGPGMFGAYQIAGFSALALFFPLESVRSQGAALIFIAYVVHVSLSSLQFIFGFLIMSKVPAAAITTRDGL
jgi:uncharacterized protein (TIRG00374 family)